MNILVFVLGMLMLIASLTYTVTQQTRQALLLQIEYRQYFRAKESDALKSAASKNYDDITVSSSSNNGSGGETLSSKLPLRDLLNTFSEETGTSLRSLDLFIRVIEQAYGKTEFYQEMLQAMEKEAGLGSQDVLRLMVQSIVQYARSEEGSVKKNQDLLKVPFAYVVLRNGFCKMLNGRVALAGGQNGYPALGTLVDVSRTKPVSVYLAKRPVLMALFRDARLVNSIIQQRLYIYERLTSDPPEIDKAEGSRELENLAGGAAQLEAESAVISYGVSKTRPPKD